MISSKPGYNIIINFIVNLPKFQYYNIILVIYNLFSELNQISIPEIIKPPKLQKSILISSENIINHLELLHRIQIYTLL